MVFLSLRVKKLEDGVGIAPTQPEGSLGFRDRGLIALTTIRRDFRFWLYDLRLELVKGYQPLSRRLEASCSGFELQSRSKRDGVKDGLYNGTLIALNESHEVWRTDCDSRRQSGCSVFRLLAREALFFR